MPWINWRYTQQVADEWAAWFEGNRSLTGPIASLTRRDRRYMRVRRSLPRRVAHRIRRSIDRLRY